MMKARWAARNKAKSGLGERIRQVDESARRLIEQGSRQKNQLTGIMRSLAVFLAA